MAQAEVYYRAALIHQQRNRYLPHSADGLEGLARSAAALGDTPRAAQLFGAAAALRETLGMPRWRVRQPAYEQALVAARSRLSDGAWASAWARGRSLALDQALAFAMGEPAPAR